MTTATATTTTPNGSRLELDDRVDETRAEAIALVSRVQRDLDQALRYLNNDRAGGYWRSLIAAKKSLQGAMDNFDSRGVLESVMPEGAAYHRDMPVKVGGEVVRTTRIWLSEADEIVGSEVLEGEGVSERVIKKRTPGKPSYVIDLDDGPGDLGREFMVFAREWSAEMDADEKKWGKETNPENVKVNKKYRDMLKAFERFGQELIKIDRKYPVKPDVEAEKWAKLFASAPWSARLLEGVRQVLAEDYGETTVYLDTFAWFAKADLGQPGRLKAAQEVLSTAMYRFLSYSRNRRGREAFVKTLRETARRMSLGVRVKNADGSIPVGESNRRPAPGRSLLAEGWESLIDLRRAKGLSSLEDVQLKLLKPAWAYNFWSFTADPEKMGVEPLKVGDVLTFLREGHRNEVRVWVLRRGRPIRKGVLVSASNPLEGGVRWLFEPKGGLHYDTDMLKDVTKKAKPTPDPRKVRWQRLERDGVYELLKPVKAHTLAYSGAGAPVPLKKGDVLAGPYVTSRGDQTFKATRKGAEVESGASFPSYVIKMGPAPHQPGFYNPVYLKPI